MPRIARVRTPDGRVVRVRVPDGASPEQIKSFVASKLNAERAPKSSGVTGFLNNAVSSLNQAAIGAVEGVHNVASAVTDTAAQALGAGDAVKAAQRQRRNVVDAVEETLAPVANPVARTGGRIAGAIAATPLRAAQGASMLARGGIRALQGGAGGAGVREVDGNALAPTATGAAANVVLGPVLGKLAQTAPAQAVGRAVGRIAAPVVNALDDAAETALPSVNRFLGRQHMPLRGAPEVTPAAPLASLGRKAQARAARFKSLGVAEPTTGMVTRDPSAVSFEQNVAKISGVGDKLAQQMKRVETSLVNVGQNMVRKLGGAKGAEATGKGVSKTLDAKRNEMQQVTSGIYRSVRAERGDVAVGRLDSFREKLTDPDLVDNPAFDQMREAVVRRLTSMGVVGKSGGVGRPATINQTEELRKFIGSLGSGIDPSTRMMRGKLIEALDDDVVSAVGGDAFRAARESAKARFAEFQKTFAGKLADERLAPEALTRRILGDGVKLSELRAMRQSLTTGTKKQVARGKDAWKGLQAQSVSDLLNKSVDPDGNLIGSRLWTEFSKPGAMAKYREILEPQDFKMLKRLAAATRDVKSYPSGHSVNTSNTAITLANLFDDAPAAVRAGWGKLLAKVGLGGGAHAIAGATLGPVGNVAVAGARGVGEAVAATRAQEAAAKALMNRIKLAQNPEAAAAAMAEARESAASNPAVGDAMRKAGITLGGVAASPQ